MTRRTRYTAVLTAGLGLVAVAVALWWSLAARESGLREPASAAGEKVPSALARIAAAGDTGTGDEVQYRTVSAMERAAQSQSFDALLLLGDIVYDVGDPERVDETVIDPFEPLTDDGTELIPVLGNHDVESEQGDEIMERLGRDHRYYVDRVGPVRVVALDSNVVDDDQTAWLRRTLAKEPAGVRWTIAMMHQSPYSAGEHGSKESAREDWAPLFARYDVPLVLAGHDHDYQRSEEIDGVTYVVSGGGGAELRPTGSAAWTVASRSVHHFLDITVYQTHIAVRAVDHAGRVVDSFRVS
jgi:UDP-2,3-diacylglucosamine pyrophosphatase LpxH